jgi:DNA-binding CsgD family transcriptional regulator
MRNRSRRIENGNDLHQAENSSHAVLGEYLKARLALVWKGLLPPKDLSQFEHREGQRLTELLEMIDERLTNEEFEVAAQAVEATILFEVRVLKTTARALAEFDQLFNGEHWPSNFEEQLRYNVDFEKMMRPLEGHFDTTFTRMLENPIPGFFRQIEAVVWQRRLFRRYLRSRFGFKQKLLRQMVLQQTRTAKDENSFHVWLGKQVTSPRIVAGDEIHNLFAQWEKEQLYKRSILHYALGRFRDTELQFQVWLAAMSMSLHAFFPAHPDEPGFNLSAGVSEILRKVEIVLKEFGLILKDAELGLRRESGLSQERPLARLSAWMRNSLSLGTNQRAAKALDSEDSRRESLLLDHIPAALLLALEQRDRGERYTSGSGETSVISRVAEMLAQDIPLEAKHEELRQGHLRNRRRAGESLDCEVESSLTDNPTGGSDLDKLSAQDFTRTEEARLALDSLAAQANLSPRESEVLELCRMDYREKEIAEALDVKEGTASALKATAKKKLRKAAGLN